jgi:D-threo-aldose 1-dehydrogenase
VIGGVFNSGILVDPAPGASFDYIPARDEVIAKAMAIQDVCRKYDVPLPAAALQFPLTHPRVCTVLIGARTVDEFDDDLALLDVEIPPMLWAELRSAGLIV